MNLLMYTKTHNIFVQNRKYRYYSFIGYLFQVIFALTLAQQAFAQIQSDSENQFDGSEFNARSYRDASLDKQPFKDMASTSPRYATSAEALMVRPGTVLLGKKRQNDINAVGGDVTEKSAENIFVNKDFAGRIEPVVDLPGDWVPDRINLSSNGGFSIEPFNGSPVPFTLNGHVDPQRDRP